MLLLHGISQMTKFSFLLVVNTFFNYLQAIFKQHHFKWVSFRMLALPLPTRARFNLDTFKVERAGTFCFCILVSALQIQLIEL